MAGREEGGPDGQGIKQVKKQKRRKKVSEGNGAEEAGGTNRKKLAWEKKNIWEDCMNTANQ